MRTLACVSLAIALAGLSGCGTGPESTVTPVTSAAPKATGMVHGGQKPVTGATIQLWPVGTTGFGSAATPLITTTVTTSDGTSTMDSNANTGNANNTLAAGSFTLNFTGAYTCPHAQATLVYMTATGGNPGLGGTVNNTAIVLLAALGQCGSLTSSTFISLNEVTTAGSVEALAPFISASGSIGSPSDSASLQAIANAFAAVNTMVNIATGSAQSPAIRSSVPLPTRWCRALTRPAPLVQLHSRCSLTRLPAAALRPNRAWRSPEHRAEPHAERHRDLQPLHHQRPLPACFDLPRPFCGTSPPAAPLNLPADRRRRRRRHRHGHLLRRPERPRSISPSTTPAAATSAPRAPASPSRSGTTYTIHGVPPGDLHARGLHGYAGLWHLNAADPTGSTTSFGVGAANVTAPTLTLTDPATVTLTSAPTLNSVGPYSGGAIMPSTRGSATTDSRAQPPTRCSGVPTRPCTVQSPAARPSPPPAAISKVWFVNAANHPELTNGSVYYFRAYGTSAGTSQGPYSTIYGPVTIGRPPPAAPSPARSPLPAQPPAPWG